MVCRQAEALGGLEKGEGAMGNEGNMRCVKVENMDSLVLSR